MDFGTYIVKILHN